MSDTGASKPNTFFIDGREIDIRAGRDDLPRRTPARHQAAAPVLPAQARLPAGRQLPRLHGRDRGRARARRKLHPHAARRHEGQDRRPIAPRPRAAWSPSCCSPISPPGSARTIRTASFGRSSSAGNIEPGRFPKRQPTRAGSRPQPSGDGGQSRRLHPMQSLRPRLPRSAGQRRHRHGRPRPSREDRVRFRRPDGRLDLRRLRRMRAGLPDRRADAGDAGRRQQRVHHQARPLGRQRVPVLRRRLPAHLSHQGRQAALLSPARTARPTRTGSASKAASASITCTIRSG